MKRILSWFKAIANERCLRNKFPDSIIHQGAKVDKTSQLGKYCVLFSNTYLHTTQLGQFSYVQSDSMILNAEIGPYCSIASGVHIGLPMHPMTMVSTNPVFYDNTMPLPRFFTKSCLHPAEMPTTFIGADVWIGRGVLIKPGVKIGVGAVIGAGAVVTKDVPPYMIAAGNPCRPIRPRFPKEICQRLLDSQWWELDEETLQGAAQYFHDPELLCDYLKPVTSKVVA